MDKPENRPKDDATTAAKAEEKPIIAAEKPVKNLTPKETEKAKTVKEKALDWSYTANHAIYCLTTDFIVGPAVNAWLQESPKFKKGVEWTQDKLGLTWLGERFERLKEKTFLGKIFGDEEKAHGDYGTGNAVSRFFDKHKTARSVVCEVAGDGLAVPFTVMVQRLFPGFMDGIRRVSEKIIGPAFRASSTRTAKQWAQKHGHSLESQEYKDKLEEIYRYEVDHAPQAYVWSVSAIGFNALAHKAVGNKNSLGVIAAAKTADALLTLVTVMLFRGVFPGAAHKWDNFTSEKIIVPLSKKMGTHEEEEQKNPSAPAAAQTKPEVSAEAAPKEKETPLTKLLQQREQASGMQTIIP